MDLLTTNRSSRQLLAEIPRPDEPSNHHLLCMPLALEQAVYLPCRWKDFTPGPGPFLKERRYDRASQCLHDASPSSSDMANIHLRNLLLILRHPLLEWDAGSAAAVAALLTGQRVLVPDVIFKAGLAVLDQAPIHDSQARLIRFLRETAEASNPPRTSPLYLELARRHILAGHLHDARRELTGRLKFGRLYNTSPEYMHSLGLTGFLSILSDASVPRMHEIGGGGGGDDEQERSRGVGGGGGDSNVPGPTSKARARGCEVDLCAGDERDVERGGVGGWCSFGLDSLRARAFKGHESYDEARRRLGRALELERSDASSHLLVRLLCMGGDFGRAVRVGV